MAKSKKKKRVSARAAKIDRILDNDGMHRSTPVVTPVAQATDEQKKADAEKKLAEERTRLTDAGEAVLAALRNDKHEDAKKRLVDLARALGDDLFTRTDTTKLLALAKDAHDAKMSIGVYVEEVKRRLAIYERVVNTKSLWGIAGMDALAAVALGGMGMAYMMSKFGKSGATETP